MEPDVNIRKKHVVLSQFQRSLDWISKFTLRLKGINCMTFEHLSSLFFSARNAGLTTAEEMFLASWRSLYVRRKINIPFKANICRLGWFWQNQSLWGIIFGGWFDFKSKRSVLVFTTSDKRCTFGLPYTKSIVSNMPPARKKKKQVVKSKKSSTRSAGKQKAARAFIDRESGEAGRCVVCLGALTTVCDVKYTTMNSHLCSFFSLSKMHGLNILSTLKEQLSPSK